MKLTYFIYLQLTIPWLIKHFTVIYGDANEQFFKLNLNIFGREKISLSGTPISLPKIADLPIWAQEKITCMLTECNVNDWTQLTEYHVNDWTQLIECNINDWTQLIECNVNDWTQLTECNVNDWTQLTECNVNDWTQLTECNVNDWTQLT